MTPSADHPASWTDGLSRRPDRDLGPYPHYRALRRLDADGTAPAPGQASGRTMTFETVRTFFALLAIAALAGSVMGGAALIRSARTPGSPRPELLAQLDGVELTLAFVVATTATLGSLYLSEIAHLEPCRLCWYQRIAMYPLAVILGIAAARKDSAIRPYAATLAVGGAAIAAYHYLIQQFPAMDAGACSVGVPCSAAYFWVFGFISIPFMALSGFIAVLVLLAIHRSNERHHAVLDRDTPRPEWSNP